MKSIQKLIFEHLFVVANYPTELEKDLYTYTTWVHSEHVKINR
jgi:hypothetical protein